MSDNDNRRFDEYLAFRNQKKPADWKPIALGVFVGGFALFIVTSIIVLIFAGIAADETTRAMMAATGISKQQMEKAEADMRRKMENLK